MMENKYYTPKLEEFYKGYECEILSSYGWQKGVFPDVLFEDTLTGFTAQKDLFLAAEKASIKTKYLDKEDIEEVLQIKQLKGDNIELNFQLLTEDGFLFYEIDYDTEDKRMVIEKWYQTKMVNRVTGSYNCYTLFDGIIKNKNEFKKLLNQLEIQ